MTVAIRTLEDCLAYGTFIMQSCFAIRNTSRHPQPNRTGRHTGLFDF
jgi:hypothetical protein